MRVVISIEGDLEQMMADEVLTAEKAVTRAMRRFAASGKAEWRGQVSRALGAKLGNAVRSAVYPKTGESIEAAAQVYTRAPEIIGAHERGVTIRSKDGFWLAIPTVEAGPARRGTRMTPGAWEQKTGRRLRFIYRRGLASLLVADAKFTKAGRVGKGRMTKSGRYGTGAVSVVIFILVPQVRLPKRLSLMASGERLAAQIPADIVANWPE